MTALLALTTTMALAVKTRLARLRCPHPEALERPVWLKIYKASAGGLEAGVVRRCGLCGRERVTLEREVQVPIVTPFRVALMAVSAAAVFVLAREFGVPWVAELIGGFLEK